MPASCRPISSLPGLPAGHAKGLAKGKAGGAKAKRRPAARIRGMPFMPDGGGARRSSTGRLARAYTGRVLRVHGAAAVHAWDKRRVCTGRTPHANTQARVSRKFAGQQAFLPAFPRNPRIECCRGGKPAAIRPLGRPPSPSPTRWHPARRRPHLSTPKPATWPCLCRWTAHSRQWLSAPAS